MPFKPEIYASEFGFMPGEKVVDLLAGVGHMAFALRKTVTDTGHIYAVDRKEASLVKMKNEALKHNIENLDVIIGDIETDHGSKLRDELCSGAVFGGGISKIKNIDAALKEARRIIKPGGKICILEWKKTEPDLETVKKWCMDAGLQFEKKFEAGEEHYGLIFKKSLE